MTNGYFKIQQSLANSQQEVEDLLKPLFDEGVLADTRDSSNPKGSIDNVSKTLRRSLQDLQKMQINQNMILNQFKNLTTSFKGYSKSAKTCDMGTQTDLHMHNVQEIGSEERKMLDDKVCLF